MTAETSNARGWVLVPREVVDFLMGEGELQGVWFGETPAGERRWLFWRKHLRHAKDAALAAEGVQAGEVASWQRSIELRPGHWGEWAEYTDIYGEGRPEKVGRFNCRYRPLYTASALSQQPEPKAEARGVVDLRKVRNNVLAVIPGGSICDPQQVADDVRAVFAIFEAEARNGR